MPLQRLSGHSQKPSNTPTVSYKQQASPTIITTSTRPTIRTNSLPPFFNSPLFCPAHKPHPSQPRTVGGEFQRPLESYGDALNLNFRTRKFADFSAGEEVTIGRGTAPTPCSRYRQAILETPDNHIAPPDFLPEQPISQLGGQPTTSIPEDNVTFPTFQHSAIRNFEDHSTFLNFQDPAALSTSLQLPQNSEFNAPANNWNQASVSSCVIGVALVAVATGYACTTVFRGALNVGKFIYSNRGGIQRTCTQAVQSAYNSAKRRMVSIHTHRLPVGMRRRYAPQPKPQNRRRQRCSFQQPRVPAQLPAQSLQSTNPVVSILAPEGMPGVEYSGLSDVGKLPDRQDAADLDDFVLPWSSGALALGAPYMTGGLFDEQILPPAPVHGEPASENPIGTVGPEDWWSLPEQSEPPCPSNSSNSLADPNQAGPASASPVFETASPITEATAPVIEHASLTTIKPGFLITEPGSPHLLPPVSDSPPPAPISQGRLTPTPSPLKASALQAGKSRRRKAAPGTKAAEMPKSKNSLPSRKSTRNPPCKHSPPKPIRRSKRIAELKGR